MLRTLFFVFVITCVVVDTTPAERSSIAEGHPFIITDSSGVYYARCIPGLAGKPGTTTIFRVRWDKDELVDKYESWFARGFHPNRLFLMNVGWNTNKQKPLIAIFRPHVTRIPSKPDEQVEFGIYLGGKRIRNYTTKELKELGAEIKKDAGQGRLPKGDYAVYKFQGYDGYRQGKTKYGCFSFTFGKKTVLIDIATGDIIMDPYPQAIENKTGTSNKSNAPDPK